MTDWKVLALSTPLLFVMYQSLSKLLPKGTSVLLVVTYGSLVAAALLFMLHLATASDKSLSLNSKQLFLALGIGVLIGLGNFGIIKAYSLGAPQSLFTIIFYIALIIYGIIFGLLFWQERLNLVQIFGITLAVAGVYLVVRYRG